MGDQETGQVKTRRQLLAATALLTAFLSFPALADGMVWLFFLIPLPIAFYLLTFGSRVGLALVGAAVVAATGITLAAGDLGLLLFSFSLMPVGFALAAGATEKRSPAATGGRGLLGLLLIWLLLASVVGTIHHQNPYREMVETLDTVIAASAEAYRKSPEFNKDHQVEFESLIGQMRTLAPRVLPAMIGNSMLFLVWLNLVLVHWLLNKKQPALSPWPEYKDWQLPDHLVWLVIAGGGLQLIPSVTLHTVGLNTLLLVGVLYLFQGLAVLNSLLLKWAVPQPVKIFIYLLLMLQFYGVFLLTILGLTDVWIKFRRSAPEPS